MRYFGWAFAALFAVAVMTAGQAQATVVITIDKSTQRMSVSVDGAVRWQWRVSTGGAGHDTPSGTFRAFRMEASHFSKEWDDAPMPHSIFFTQRGRCGSRLSQHQPSRPAGVARLRAARSTQNATALYAVVKQEGVAQHHGRRHRARVGRGGTAAAQRRAIQPQPAEEEVAQPAYPASPSYGGGNNYPYSRDDRFYGGPAGAAARLSAVPARARAPAGVAEKHERVVQVIVRVGDGFSPLPTRPQHLHDRPDRVGERERHSPTLRRALSMAARRCDPTGRHPDVI